MQRSLIHPSLFQSMLDSAPNAVRKGQAQYFTPPAWAKRLALPLPRHRPVIVDLTCGNGALLKGAANDSTQHRLGCDIGANAQGPRPNDQCPALDIASLDIGHSATHPYLTADLTLLAPLLLDVGFEADLFVLNPPWDLHWHRDRLALLAKSSSHSAQAAFAAHDGRTSRGTIDSCIATLCLALTLGSDYAEGYLIMNASTARRLLLDDGAPHVDLRDHVWAVLDLPADTAAPVPACVLYWAKDHLSGPKVRKVISESVVSESVTDPSTLQPFNPSTDSLITFADRTHREGCEVSHYLYTRETVPTWKAAADEYQRLHAPSSGGPAYNVWLDASGHIRAHVSLYDERTGRVPATEAALLHGLAGRRPMQLVVQRSQRDALLRACGLRSQVVGRDSVEPSNSDSPWRIDPALQRAVLDALRDYHAARAPLYPLPAIQRLGYCDEADELVCKNTLYAEDSPVQWRTR